MLRDYNTHCLTAVRNALMDNPPERAIPFLVLAETYFRSKDVNGNSSASECTETQRIIEERCEAQYEIEDDASDLIEEVSTLVTLDGSNCELVARIAEYTDNWAAVKEWVKMKNYTSNGISGQIHPHSLHSWLSAHQPE